MESLSPYKKEIAIGILKQIEQAIIRLQERTANIHTVDDFLLSPTGMEKLDAACMLLIAIGESLKGFDKITEKKVLVTYPQIPWSNVMGVRDIIAHHYFDIDAEEIFGIVHDELPSLLEAVRYFIRELSYFAVTVGANEKYKDKLNTVEWQRKCEEIKRRDNYRCVNCKNQVLVELNENGIDDLKRYLGEIETRNFEQIKELFLQKESIVGERESIKEEKCIFLDVYGLYYYEMETKTKCFWDCPQKRILITSKRIEDFKEIENRLYKKIAETLIYYGGKDYTLQPDNIITLQFNELGDTGNRYFLHRYFVDNSLNGYPGSYRGQGILTYNQYSVIFPLYSLDFEQSLDVHHKVYRKKDGQFIEPWEYEDNDLETLCHNCHLKKHELPIPIIDE